MTASPQQIHDAAWNAVAVASLAYAIDPSDQERLALTRMLTTARGHGLTATDLREASGLDEPFIHRLLDEAAD